MKYVMVQDRLGCRLINGETGNTISTFDGRIMMKLRSKNMARRDEAALWNRKSNGLEVRVKL